MVNSCCFTQLPNMSHLENSSLLSLTYKCVLLVSQALSMYSCRGLLWNSQLYSYSCLVRNLRHSSILENLAANSTHSPMSSLIFLFSSKTMSWTIQTFYFNIIRFFLKCMIFPRKSSTCDSSALLNVSIYTRCPMITALS